MTTLARVVGGLLLAVAGVANAATLEELANQGPQLSSKEQTACKAMMCMAAPGGWSSIKECIKPVRDFQRMVHKPKCPLIGDSDTASTETHDRGTRNNGGKPSDEGHIYTEAQ